jgi:hypothetical protein
VDGRLEVIDTAVALFDDAKLDLSARPPIPDTVRRKMKNAALRRDGMRIKLDW